MSGESTELAGVVGPLGRRWRVAAASLAALYGLLLVLFRPASPYEWDEVLFIRGLDRYDVASHSPHPPGYPVYMAAGKLVRFFARDPNLALELVGIAAALVGLWFLWRTAREFGVPPAAALAASTFVAVTPGFAFNANVALSDVPGAAAATVAVWALVRAKRNPDRLPLAAAMTAVALGVRPQLVFALLVPTLVALWPAVRGRRWKSLLLSTAAGIAVLLACWVPAAVVTGASRFVFAVRSQAQWAAINEAGYHLPKATLGEALEHWLIFPFGSTEMAIVFWLLVVAGTVAWLLASRRVIVLFAAGSGFGYLVLAMFTMNYTTAVRYIVPALPPLALLASGVLASSRPALRRAGAGLGVAWCVAVVAWGAPVYALRRAVAPCWEALEWVARTYPPATTTVVYQGLLIPHAPQLLLPPGFKVVCDEEIEKLEAAPQARQTVLDVGPEVPTGGEVLFSRVWSSGRLRRLTRDRYHDCKVTRVRSLETAGPLAGWRTVVRPAADAKAGEIRVGGPSRPAVVRACAAGVSVNVRPPGQNPLVLAPWACSDVAVLPSSQGEIAVTDAAGRPASGTFSYLLPFGEMPFACRPSPMLVIPQAARVTGRGGALWRTDLVVVNPSHRPIEVAARLLWPGQKGGGGPEAKASVSPGGVLVVPDVLALGEFAGREGVGALVLEAFDGSRPCRRDECALLAWARTYNSSARPTGWAPGEWLPGLPPRAGIEDGRKAALAAVTNDSTWHASVGAASLSDRPVTVRVRVFAASGEAVEESANVLPGFGHFHRALESEVVGGRVEVEVAGGARGALVFPYVSMVNAEGGAVRHMLPQDLSAPNAPSRSGQALQRRRP